MRLSIVNGDRIANRRRIYKMYTVIYPPPGQSTTPTTQNQSNICESQPFSSTILNVNRTFTQHLVSSKSLNWSAREKKISPKKLNAIHIQIFGKQTTLLNGREAKKSVFIWSTQHSTPKRNETKRNDEQKKLMNIFTLIWPSSRSFPQTRSIWHWTCFFFLSCWYSSEVTSTHTQEHVIYVGAFLFTNEKKVIAVSNRYEMKSTHYAFKIDLVCFRIVSLCRPKKGFQSNTRYFPNTPVAHLVNISLKTVDFHWVSGVAASIPFETGNVCMA